MIDHNINLDILVIKDLQYSNSNSDSYDYCSSDY